MRTLGDRRLSERTLQSDSVLPEGPAGHWVAADVAASPVSFWPDRSGNGLDMQQATPGSQPVLTDSGLAGQPVVTFDGSDDYLIGPSISRNQPFSVIGVVRHHNADTAQRGFFGGNSGTVAGPVVYTEGGVWRMFAGSNLASTIAVDDKWHIVAAVWQSNNGLLIVDNLSIFGAVGNRPLTVPRLGGYGNNASNLVGPWDGDIAEVVFYDRALNSGEIAQARASLGHKYGL